MVISSRPLTASPCYDAEGSASRRRQARSSRQSRQAIFVGWMFAPSPVSSIFYLFIDGAVWFH
ncbi:MAG TPA: hypothetical protein DCO82_00050 [Alphaproteobacteria bacterium]|nr:hypothetical protein [Alphaproteobacteria bacterium]